MNAQDMHAEIGESKTRKRKSTRDCDLWYKRYPARFRRDTMHDHPMSFELRGAWSLLTDLFYEHGGPLPNDDRWIAIQLGCDVRKWKHIRSQLFEAGKLTVGSDGLVHNKTADEVLGERAVKLGVEALQKPKRRLGKGATRAGTDPSTPATTQVGSGGGSSADLSETASDTSDGASKPPGDTRASQTPELREEKKITTSAAAKPPAAAAGLRIDSRELSNKLFAACNGALASEAIAPGLASMATPIWWLEQGCDLERDVLPTLTAIGKRDHGKRIKSWGYFTEPVTAAKAAREKPLPDAGPERRRDRMSFSEQRREENRDFARMVGLEVE